jgi:K+-transporting ATPase c subunit
MTQDQVREVVKRHTSQPFLGFIGSAGVHVLELNLDLDGLLN